MEARSRRLGLQHGNSVGRAVFLSKGQACRGVLPNEDLPDKKCRQLGCRHCWSRQDSAHGHSQTQILLFWTVFAVTLGANEARREGPAWCVSICQHRRPDGWQRSGPSEVDGWLVKRHRIERRCSNQLGRRWMQQPGFAERLLIAGWCVTAGADKSSCWRRSGRVPPRSAAVNKHADITNCLSPVTADLSPEMVKFSYC